MVDTKIRVILEPDSKKLDKELKKERRLGLGVGGRRSLRGGGNVAVGAAAGASAAGDGGIKLAGFGKLLGLVGLGVAVLESLNFILKPIMDLFKVVLSLLFLPLIPILRPVMIALGRLAAGLAPIMIKIKDAIENVLTERLERLVTGFVDLFVANVDSFSEIILAFFDIFSRFLPLYDVILDAILTIFNFFAESAEPITNFIIGILDFFANDSKSSFELIIDVLNFAKKFLSDNWNTIKEVLNTVTSWIDPVWNSIKASLEDAADRILPKLSDVLTSLINLLVDVFNTLSQLANKLLPGDPFGELDRIVKVKITEIPQQFLPGISVADAIIRPNGQIIRTDPADTLIATKTPEALFGMSGGGSVTQNISVNATINSDMDIQILAQRLAELSKDELARSTGSQRF